MKNETLKTDVCYWCGEDIEDGADGSGFTGIGPDWMTHEGDYGCNENPITGEDGAGSHYTEEEVREVWRIAELEPGTLKPFSTMRVRLYGCEQETAEDAPLRVVTRLTTNEED